MTIDQILDRAAERSDSPHVSQMARDALREIVGLRGPRATKALADGEYDTDWRMEILTAFEAAVRTDERARLVERVRSTFRLKWISGARPPVHPEPMNGSQIFRTFDDAIACMKRQASDAQFVSLTEIQTSEIDRSDEALSALEGE